METQINLVKEENKNRTLSPLVRKLGNLVHLTEDEIEYLEGLQVKHGSLTAEEDLIVEGDEFRSTYIVRSGWGQRYRILQDGRRQITSLLLPGDFIGLNSNFRRTANYSVAALTDMEVGLVEPTRVIEIQQQYPILASALSWSTVRDYVILSEHIVGLGRRSAYERMAHLLMEIYHRLNVVNLAREDGFDWPLTQNQIADMLGLSVVHVNRTLRRLREDELVAFDDQSVELLNMDELMEVADAPDAFLEDFAIL